MAIKNVVARGFGPGATIAFVVTRGFTIAEQVQTITDTDILQKPVDFFMPELPQYAEIVSEVEFRPPNVRAQTKVRKGAGGRLSQSAPSFTVKTSKRGYD